ncbi:MAG: hypothetical protein ACK8QZ_07975, partial [Anaerolineales bacterium]
RSHVMRNTEQLVEELKGLAKRDVDGSLAAIGVRAEQAVADLDRLKRLVQEQLPAGMHGELLAGEGAARGGKGQRGISDSFAVAVAGSVEFVVALDDLSAMEGELLDGTNNASERAIGWWVERYRTMRGYKRVESAVNVSRLLAWCGNHLERGGVNLAGVLS